MDSTSFVTVAIPFFYSERYLEKAICSVLNQTYTNFELILINDGGLDGSIEIANKYAKLDSRIRVIDDGYNKGLAARINETVKLAKGDFYVRMDDDDIMARNRISEQISYLHNHPEVDLVGSSAMVIDGNDNITLSIDMSDCTTSFLHPTVTGRTKWFLSNPYNEHFKRAQDAELWLRTAEKSVFRNLTCPLLFYRETRNTSLKKSLISHKILRDMYKDYQRYGKSYMWYVKKLLFSYIKDLMCIVTSVFMDSNSLRNMMRKRLPKELELTNHDIEMAVNKLAV